MIWSYCLVDRQDDKMTGSMWRMSVKSCPWMTRSDPQSPKVLSPQSPTITHSHPKSCPRMTRRMTSNRQDDRIHGHLEDRSSISCHSAKEACEIHALAGHFSVPLVSTASALTTPVVAQILCQTAKSYKFSALAQKIQLQILESKDAISRRMIDKASFDSRILS